MQCDNQLNLQLPEGAMLNLIPAGVGVRFMAFVVDFIIRITLFIVLALVAGQMGEFGEGLMLLTWFLLEWFYPVFFELYRGSTPGKKLYKLEVVQDNGLPVSASSSLVRNLFRAIDFLPVGYMFGFICTLCNIKFQRIGDLVAGTLVVYEAENKVYKNIEDDRQLQINLPLTPEQQSALLNYIERFDSFSGQRADELAAILEKYLPKSHYDAKETLKILAAQLTGKQ